VDLKVPPNKEIAFSTVLHIYGEYILDNIHNAKYISKELMEL
jgi:hypothetical protein